MTRALIIISLAALLAACAAEATQPPAPEGAPTVAEAEAATPAKVAKAAVAPTPAKAPEAKPVALASSEPAVAPTACGEGGVKKDCANPDCVYAGEKKDSPGAECPHELEKKTTAAAPAAKEASHYGATFTLVANQPLSKSLKTPADTMTQVTGSIDKVCKKKGCWMVLKDGEVEARVLMKNYGFTVPVDCDGKVAAVEGTMKTRTFTEGQAKHLAEDGGEDPSKVKGTRTEIVITASGIRIQG
jgi:hypothetical protein